MKKRLLLTLAMLLLSQPVCRAQQAEDEAPGSVMWMTLWTKGKKAEQYMELRKDGALVSRTEAKKAALTRRGTVDTKLAEQFFRLLGESGLLEDSAPRAHFEDMSSQELADISAYRYGELRHSGLPLAIMSKPLKEALAKIKKAADGLPSWKGPYLFMSAEPLSQEDVENEELRLNRLVRFTEMKTADMERFPPIVTALYRPRRLIELPEKKDGDALLAFIKAADIKNFGDSFYIATDRGRFKIQLLAPNK